MKPVEAQTVGHAIVLEELRLLGRVAAALSEIGSQVVGAPDFNEALLNLRDQISEAKPEDIGPLVEQMMRISAIAQRYGKGRDLPVNPRSPYFAHLRLSASERSRDVLIGKRGYIDRRRDVQIVDWRHAPVSRIYYRYQEGDDYEEPVASGTLSGVVEARRNLTIDEGRLRRIGCPQGTFVADDHGGWFEAEPVALAELRGGQLSASRPGGQRNLGVHSEPAIRADKHLPEIAALIDPAQFDLIIRPESGLVVLQGGAGSGKTTVALHRVAYLAFAQPSRFRTDRMLVLVLSEAMVRYVEQVLPALGVPGVPVMTAQAWLQRTRRRVLPAFAAPYNEDTPAAVLRFKKHPLLLALLREHVHSQVAQVVPELARALGDAPGADQVLARWDALAGLSPVKRCRALRQWLERADAALPALTLQLAQGTCRRVLGRLRQVASDCTDLLTDRPLLERAVARLAPGEFTPSELAQVCAWCARQSEEAERPRGERRRDEEGEDEDSNPYISLDGIDERDVPVAGRLDPPDDALLLYLYWLKHGALETSSGKPIRYEHLVVDEAQDLSAIEVKVLLSVTTELQSVTLAGDVAQRVVFDNAFSTWERLLDAVGVQPAESGTLRLGYRSTQPIMAFAQRVIGSLERSLPLPEWNPVRAGASVDLFRFGDQGEAVAFLAEALRSLAAREPLASVACIARFPEQARSYATALQDAEVPAVRLVAQQEFSFKPGVEVADVVQVKGLEFDYVILLDVTAANYPETQESRHLLYIGATRAAHQLWLLAVGAPSPLLPAELDPGTRPA